MKKPKSPILPRNIKDPAATDKLERGAMKSFAIKLNQVGKQYAKLLDRIPSQPVVNKKYAYQLDDYLLNSILSEGERLIDSIILEGGKDNLWFYSAYVSTAYQRGTAQEFANLATQSVAYLADKESLGGLLLSEPYRNRIALVRARVFEEMKGFSGQVKADMARILADGIGRGLNPRDIAKSLQQKAGLEQGRANRIARTEINTALRRARWDESEDAQERYGFKTMLMHISALSPTTRPNHAARHGKLFTIEEVREWFADGSNSINCKCVTISVIVDENGNPLNDTILDRARKMLSKSRLSTNQKCSCCH